MTKFPHYERFIDWITTFFDEENFIAKIQGAKSTEKCKVFRHF